ncbi:chemotaxis protein [Escherichia coli]|nr:chemotaxis protein [Escherichia coli]KAA2115587.1 chemotaxis protein [Escherichia coli]KAA2155800.1 chemotaxis protein [Escherichia coli]RXC01041.1 chemotaxis protein [Escherichia coli]
MGGNWRLNVLTRQSGVTNGAIVIHTQRLKSDPGGNLLS